ncbi:hypothetical protein J4G43_026080 [Bradyrhizobium barranii subsp. barranii]|uniref:Uncharacterized protein n=1 Tax=Bradyrhizobium barranii subsp. barranii TaxID=2823807 RepID=A0A9X9XKU5_9BRAD|nr:hypothetical protein [Bradyrhizobium barranii]UEM08289.1 hypothetical protein J4G43_026080 [Bradyrhizobium barranii subsp. barranii]
MKYFLSGLIAISLAIAATASFAADARNVTVVNETGYAIKFLGFNAPDDGLDEWENELDKVLQNQASTYVEFEEDDEGCVWNIVSDVRVPLAKVWRGDCSLLINVFANRWRGVWRRQRRRITRCGRTTRAGARRSGTAGDRLRSL